MRCLSIPLAADFQPGSTVLDVGTGGGLPGLVSAICAPDVRFTLVDTQRKKILAVAKMATLLGVKNVLPFHQQVEHIAQQYDFVTGRAVIRLPTFLPMVTKNLRGGIARSETDGLDGSRLGSRLGPGILYLKGGDFDEEVQELGFSPLRSRLDRWIPNFDGTQELLYFRAKVLPDAARCCRCQGCPNQQLDNSAEFGMLCMFGAGAKVSRLEREVQEA